MLPWISPWLGKKNPICWGPNQENTEVQCDDSESVTFTLYITLRCIALRQKALHDNRFTDEAPVYI